MKDLIPIIMAALAASPLAGMAVPADPQALVDAQTQKQFSYRAEGVVECRMEDGTLVCRPMLSAGVVYAFDESSARLRAQAEARVEFGRHGRVIGELRIGITGNF